MNNKSVIKNAFTLIELLVVIAIIGILSGLIIVGMNSSVKSANLAKAQIFSASLRDSLLANLISEWKFDELSTATNGATIVDSWSGGNNCTLSCGTGDVSDKLTSGSSCIYNKCVSFDGNSDYLNCVNNSGLNITNTITVSAWVKYNAYGNTHDSWLACKRASSWTDDGYCLFWGYGNDLYFNIGDNTAYVVYAVSSPITRGWIFITGTYDGTNLKLYLDGLNVATSTPAHGMISNAQSLMIGGNSTATFSLNGLIDDVRVYNASIPTSQIEEQYFAGINRLLAGNALSRNEYLNKIK